MGTKGLEGDISTSKNFTLQDILEGVLPGRSILIRIEVPEDGTKAMISIVEEL